MYSPFANNGSVSSCDVLKGREGVPSLLIFAMVVTNMATNTSKNVPVSQEGTGRVLVGPFFLGGEEFRNNWVILQVQWWHVI